MKRRIAVPRPAPGTEATARAIAAAGHVAIRMPLFDVVALDWLAPDPADHDALILTSANGARHAGHALAALADLPVYAVGESTARSAREAGLNVVSVGTRGVEALLDTRAPGRSAAGIAPRRTRSFA